MNTLREIFQVCGTFVLLATAALRSHAAPPFQQDHRVNSLTMQFGTDTFATQNAFGGAFTGGLVRQQLQQSISNDVTDGSISIIFRMLGLDDLTGISDPDLKLGILNGTPITPAGNPASYSGNADLDWWYTPALAGLGADGLPVNQLNASFTAGTLNSSGTGQISIGSGGFPLTISNPVLTATAGAASTPLQSTNNLPPGHRPSEQLPPGLQSFGTMTGGKMKGNISAASLAGTPIPADFVGAFGSSPAYTSANSMLDLLVGGYSVFSIQQVRPTQPDADNPTVPNVGAGPPYIFTTNAVTRQVNGARDKNNAAVDLAAALNDAAYSCYFTFTTDRVILHFAPDIIVEQPLGTALADGGSRNFGSTAVGGEADLTFTVSNSQLSDLASINVGIDGPDAAMFTVSSAPAATLLGPESTTFTIRFTPTSTGAKSAFARITSTDPDESPFDIQLNGTGLTALEAWRQLHFGSPANAGDGADLNDFDYDGIPNLVEFAFGLIPTLESAGDLPQAQIEGTDYVITFTEPPGVSGITYGAERSFVLPAAWQPVADTGTPPQHRFSIPMAGNPKAFLRLVITAP